MRRSIFAVALIAASVGLLSAAPYSHKAAMATFAKVLPKDAPRQFLSIPVDSKDRPSDDLLEFLRLGRGKTTYIGIVSPKLKYVENYVSGALKLAKDEKFDGVTLLICTDKDGTERFTALLKDTGIKAICTTVGN